MTKACSQHVVNRVDIESLRLEGLETSPKESLETSNVFDQGTAESSCMSLVIKAVILTN